MVKIQWRQYDFNIKEKNGKRLIWDIIRSKYIVLTPEEWVRQNLVHYLIFDLGYPKNLFALEKKVVFNQLSKRFDIVIYDAQIQPWMLIECKEPSVTINDVTLSQSLVYHTQLGCKHIVLTNGKTTFCSRVHADRLEWCEQFPKFEE